MYIPNALFFGCWKSHGITPIEALSNPHNTKRNQYKNTKENIIRVYTLYIHEYKYIYVYIYILGWHVITLVLNFLFVWFGNFFQTKQKPEVHWGREIAPRNHGGMWIIYRSIYILYIYIIYTYIIYIFTLKKIMSHMALKLYS